MIMGVGQKTVVNREHVATHRVVLWYVSLTLLLSWILEYFYVFKDQSFSFRAGGFYFIPVMMVPGFLFSIFVIHNT